MPLTALDPVPALVVVDLQTGVLGIPAAHPVEDVVARSAALAAAFRNAGLPVVLVTVTGGAPGRTDASNGASRSTTLPPEATVLASELGRGDDDILITKRTWGAFTNTGLDDRLRERAATQVVITGVATSIGVESTARAAHELGYHVVLVTDAMTDRDGEAHESRIATIFPRLGETTTTADVLEALAAR